MNPFTELHGYTLITDAEALAGLFLQHGVTFPDVAVALTDDGATVFYRELPDGTATSTILVPCDDGDRYLVLRDNMDVADVVLSKDGHLYGVSVYPHDAVFQRISDAFAFIAYCPHLFPPRTKVRYY